MRLSVPRWSSVLRRRPALKPSGLLLFEFGFGQVDAVRQLVQGTAGLALAGIRNDLQGIPRTAIVRRTGART